MDADTYIKSIAARIELLEGDELAMVDRLLARLEQGRKDYGVWDVNDDRNNSTEALEEICDALHYCAAELVKLDKRGK